MAALGWHVGTHADALANISRHLYRCKLNRTFTCPTTRQMWREAFESVADDVDRLSRDLDERVAQDPLASIGMVRPDISSPSKEKSSAKSPGASSVATKRRRKEDKDRKEADAAAAADPFARRRTRPQSYWTVGNDPESSTEVPPEDSRDLITQYS